MLFGVIVCVVGAVVATLLADVQHIIGAPMIGLFIGIILSNALPQLMGGGKKGFDFASKRILRIGIIIAGGTLNFSAIMKVGAKSLPLVIGAIVLSFISAWFYGKAMHATDRTRLLVGGGTSICGGTAIATLSAVVHAKEDETAYAMTSIFLWDILAALIWPYVAVALNFSPAQYGLLGGVAINDVSSVTAAGDTYNALMGAAAYNELGMSGSDLAMIVKLTRVSMLVIVALIIIILGEIGPHNEYKQEGSSILTNIIKAFPFYVLGFLALAVVNTVVDFKSIMIAGTSFGSLFSPVYKFCFAMALVGVGSKIKLKEMFTKGVKPIILGGLTWATLSVVVIAYAVILY